MNSWLYLLLAIGLEVVGTTCMKLSAGFTRLLPSILIFVFYGLSFTCMTFAIKRIDLSIAYTIWAGVGTTLIVIIGFFIFDEPFTIIKAICILLIIVGVIGLRWYAP